MILAPYMLAFSGLIVLVTAVNAHGFGRLYVRSVNYSARKSRDSRVSSVHHRWGLFVVSFLSAGIFLPFVVLVGLAMKVSVLDVIVSCFGLILAGYMAGLIIIARINKGNLH